MTTYAVVRNYIKKKNRKNPSRVYRTPVMSGFSFEEDEFKKLYHVSKKIAKRLVETLRPDIQPKSGTRTAISAELKVLCTLRYLASGSDQTKVGQELLLCVSQSTVSRAIAAVSEGICKHFMDDFPFPTLNEHEHVKKKFSDIGGFPGVIGVVGCSHIPIAVPPSDNDPTTPQHAFLNPKGSYSINALFVCDANMKISYVNPEYPGASMDWFVCKYSSLRTLLEEQRQYSPDTWLLGGNNFQPEPWLLTPFKEPSMEAEKTYNICHQNTWNVIKECTHRLKLRFGLLRRGVHLSPTTEYLIKSCVILHNLCLDEDSDDEDFFLNLEAGGDIECNVEDDDPVEELSYCTDGYVPIDESTNKAAMLQRNYILENFFTE